jgi:hypothetical protein
MLPETAVIGHRTAHGISAAVRLKPTSLRPDTWPQVLLYLLQDHIADNIGTPATAARQCRPPTTASWAAARRR